MSTTTQTIKTDFTLFPAQANPMPALVDHRLCKRIALVDAPYYGSSIIDISVGDGELRQSFYMHESLLTSRSNFFKCAIKEPKTDPGIPIICLPKDDAVIFRLYMILTYSDHVASKGHFGHNIEWTSLTRLYVLCEKLQDTKAKNLIIDAMHDFLRESVPKGFGGTQSQEQWSKAHVRRSSLVELYEGTPIGSPARKLLVHFHANRFCKSYLTKRRDRFPADFIYELAVHLIELVPTMPGFHQPVLPLPSTEYHEPIVGMEEKSEGAMSNSKQDKGLSTLQKQTVP